MAVSNDRRDRVAFSLTASALFCALIAVFGLTVSQSPSVKGEGGANELRSSYNIFAAQDPHVAVFIAVLLGVALLMFMRRADPLSAVSLSRFSFGFSVAALTFATFLLAYFCRVVVHHSFGLSLDEFMPEFQAEIFRSGQLLAPIEPDAFKANKLLQPFFTYVNETHLLWGSGYRPVHAALIAFVPFELLNPIMAAISVWAIADVAKRVFPDQPDLPILAAILLIVSPQFLMTAGAGFAFASHLGLNMLWLALFLRKNFASHCLAAIVGFFAVGLHQVHVHPLFIAPFMLALLYGKYGHRAAIVPYAVGYGIALPLWMAWPEVAVYLQTGDVSVLPRSVWEIEYIRDYLGFRKDGALINIADPMNLTFLNMARFAVWIAPAVLPLALLASFASRRIGLTPVLAGLSFLLTVLACYVLMPNQMQSWGSRYYHPVLGCLILFSLGGIAALENADLKRRVTQMTLGLALVSAVVLVPWRAVQVEAKVGPRAEVQKALEATDASVIAIPVRDVWFGFDFIRNDPDLQNRPLFVPTRRFTDQPFFDGMAVVPLSARDIYELGLPFGVPMEPLR